MNVKRAFPAIISTTKRRVATAVHPVLKPVGLVTLRVLVVVPTQEIPLATPAPLPERGRFPARENHLILVVNLVEDF